MSLVKKKTGQSNSGFIYANQSKGKPIKLMSVSQPQTGSSSASSSTLKKRNQVIEKFVESVASATKAAADVIHVAEILHPENIGKIVNNCFKLLENTKIQIKTKHIALKSFMIQIYCNQRTCAEIFFFFTM